MEHMGKIIDFHVHPYMDEQHNLCWFTDDFKVSGVQAKADLERAGICKICGSVINKTAPEQKEGFEAIREINHHALEVKKIYGDFYEPGFHIHPGYIKESLETLEWMHQNGYRLIGEVVPYFHFWVDMGFDYGSKELQEILALANEYGMIFSYHTMPSWADQMDQTIAAFPNITFVAAHPGERSAYIRHLETLKKYDNAYLDVSGTGIARYGMVRDAVQKVGAEKILFGTDYPINNPAMYVYGVDFEEISEEEKAQIFYKNAQRIFGWK